MAAGDTTVGSTPIREADFVNGTPGVGVMFGGVWLFA